MMEILLVGGAAIVLVVAVAIRKHFRGNRVAVPSEIERQESPAIEPCRDIICKALDCIASGNVIGACENYRRGSEILYNMNTSDKGKNIYLNYLVESVDKISETARHIVTKPGYRISIYDKCEIMTIRKCIDEMLGNLDKPRSADEYRQVVADNRYFLEDVISERSKVMKHDDFNDDSQSYLYLMLLYYLHSFVNSVYRYSLA